MTVFASTRAAAGSRPQALWPVCLAGALALAVAMGIGRFAFTPLLPLMQREGFIGDAQGAALAAANYAGYLLGALTAARLARRARALVLASLAGTALVTAGAGLVHAVPAWLLLRGAAGVLSAWVMVGVSAWAIAALARGGRPHLAGWVYAGVGCGIVAAGGLGWLRAGDGAAALWLELGALAVPAIAAVAWAWRPDAPATATATATAQAQAQASASAPASVPSPALAPSAAQAAMPANPTSVLAAAAARATAPQPALATAQTPPAPPQRGHAGLVFAYGTFGFGYILPATYLPAMARALVDDPRLFGLAWPVFGLAAAVSTLIAGRLLKRFRQLDVWAFCHGLMALGVLLPLLNRSGWSIALAALAVGGSFMVATMAGLQLARERAAHDPAPLLSRMVAAFATGQIAGPLVALGLGHLFSGGGVAPTQWLAAALLVGTALWLRQQPTQVAGARPQAARP